MDQGRYRDLARLQAVIDDPEKSSYARFLADRAKKSIVRQIKDRRLTAMRERLIKAHQAKDEWEVWKIENQIKEYMHEEKLEEGYRG